MERRKKRGSRLFAFFWVVAVLALCLSLPGGTTQAGEISQGKEKKVLVVETTDIHGYLFDASSGEEDTFEYRLARIAHLVEEARGSGEYDTVLLLDGGDLYQGTPVSDMTGGAYVEAALEKMGYDAVALGNHEFDWGVTEYGADPEGTLPPYELASSFSDPQVPVLASNLLDADTLERVPFTQDYVLVERAGLRIAVVGYIPDYRENILPRCFEGYAIDADLTRLSLLIERVWEEEEPDALIVLAHGEPKPIAEAMDPERVCLVAGGHSHQIRKGRLENGVAYIQGNCYARGYATAVLSVKEEGAVTVESVGYVDLGKEKSLLYDTEENRPGLDEDILALSHEGWEALKESMGEVLGRIRTSLERETEGESPDTVAGNWTADLFRRATKEYGSCAALVNADGVRTSLIIPEGEESRAVTASDIYTLWPFGTNLLVYELTGKELARAIEDGLRNNSYGDQVAGFTFTYTVSEEEKEEVEEGKEEKEVEEVKKEAKEEKEEVEERATRTYQVLSITLDDGTEVDLQDDQTLYRVCTGSFCASQKGSVFEGKIPILSEEDGLQDNEAMVEVLREEGRENGGWLRVDTRKRGIRVEEPTAQEE